MKELLKQAQDLVDDLIYEVAQAKEKNAEANQAAAAARILKNSLESKLAYAEKRELELDNLEKPIKAAEEARRLKEENAKLATEIYKAEADLEKFKAAFRSEMAEAKSSLKKGQDELANTRENFRAKADALAEREDKFNAKLKELGLKIA